MYIKNYGCKYEKSKNAVKKRLENAVKKHLEKKYISFFSVYSFRNNRKEIFFRHIFLS